MNKGVSHSFSLVSICSLEVGHYSELREDQTERTFAHWIPTGHSRVVGGDMPTRYNSLRSKVDDIKS
jgi:hypothetical protein